MNRLTQHLSLVAVLWLIGTCGFAEEPLEPLEIDEPNQIYQLDPLEPSTVTLFPF